MADESSRVAASFDGWVLLREPLELLRDGKRSTLQELPLQILELLSSRPGQLVTREELVTHLWPKGIVDFARLLAPVMPADWSLHLYGDGPRREELKSLCGPNIVWHGHTSMDKVLADLALASVVVVPSLCEEACSTVVLEALRSGQPCYSLDRGGTPELARYGADEQLQLFADMPALVEGLLASHQHVSPGGESADVSHRMHELLDLYGRLPARGLRA